MMSEKYCQADKVKLASTLIVKSMFLLFVLNASNSYH